MSHPSRRTVLTSTGAIAGVLGLGATAASAVPPPKKHGRCQGSYHEQAVAWSGYEGAPHVRIPALAVAPSGDLLLAFDMRPGDGSDSPNPNSLWQRRSRDGGRTWGDPTVIQQGHESSEPNSQYGFSDPSYVVDRERGTVFCFSVYSKDAGVLASALGNDDEDRDVISAAVATSHDDGRTWTERLITDVVKPANCRAMFASSGAGIQLRYGPHAGRLIQQYAGWFVQDDGSEKVSAYSVYSDDHGETWTMGEPVGDSMDENKVVELSDGTVMLNSRENTRTGHRWVALSHDGGQTWTDLHRDPHLVDPGNNAQITRAYPDAPEGSAKAKVLLFSHADHLPNDRVNGTIELSEDDGRTWIRKRTFQRGECQYSVIIPVGRDRFLLAYEAAGITIMTARLDMDWILSR